jgi:glutaredoxin
MTRHPAVRYSLLDIALSLLLALLLNYAGTAVAGGIGINTALSARQTADIEVFVRAGCPHCAKAEIFLQALQHEQPELKIRIRDIQRDPAAMERLQEIGESQHIGIIRVPAFYLNGQLIVGYSDETTTGKWLRAELARHHSETQSQKAPSADSPGSCEAVESLSCTADTAAAPTASGNFELTLLGRRISLEQVGLPLFTIAMGLLDGFNPCSMWVLILMISLLAPMHDRMRMLAVAGTFVAVEGIAYFVFMAAWLNLFLWVGVSRASEIIIAGIAILAGGINLKDFWAYGWGVSLSIPKSAKPNIYAKIRRILQAENLRAAIIGAVVLAVLVQMVEFLCTSGFPALYTRILTLRQTSGLGYYGYLLLYNMAYMLDDIIVLGIGVVTLSQRRLQEKEGRWLKLASGLVMVGLGLYLLLMP